MPCWDPSHTSKFVLSLSYDVQYLLICAALPSIVSLDGYELFELFSEYDDEESFNDEESFYELYE